MAFQKHYGGLSKHLDQVRGYYHEKSNLLEKAEQLEQLHQQRNGDTKHAIAKCDTLVRLVQEASREKRHEDVLRYTEDMKIWLRAKMGSVETAVVQALYEQLNSTKNKLRIAEEQLQSKEDELHIAREALAKREQSAETAEARIKSQQDQLQQSHRGEMKRKEETIAARERTISQQQQSSQSKRIDLQDAQQTLANRVQLDETAEAKITSQQEQLQHSHREEIEWKGKTIAARERTISGSRQPLQAKDIELAALTNEAKASQEQRNQRHPAEFRVHKAHTAMQQAEAQTLATQDVLNDAATTRHFLTSIPGLDISEEDIEHEEMEYEGSSNMNARDMESMTQKIAEMKMGWRQMAAETELGLEGILMDEGRGEVEPEIVEGEDEVLDA